MPQNCNLWRCRLPLSLGERPIVISAQSHLLAPQICFRHPIDSTASNKPNISNHLPLVKASEDPFPTTFPLPKTLKHSTALR